MVYIFILKDLIVNTDIRVFLLRIDFFNVKLSVYS